MSVREDVAPEKRVLRTWPALLAAALVSCAPQAETKVRLPLPLLEVDPARPKRTPPAASKELRDKVTGYLEPLREAGMTPELARQLEQILVPEPDSALGAVWPYLLDGNERLALFAAEHFDRQGRLPDVPRGARVDYLIARMENLAVFFDGPPHAELPHLREMKLLSRLDAGAIRSVLAAYLRAPEGKLRDEFSAVLASLTGESLESKVKLPLPLLEVDPAEPKRTPPAPSAEAWRAWERDRALELTGAEGHGRIDRAEVARRLRSHLQAHPADLPALVGYALAEPAMAGRFMLRADPQSARKERAYALAFVPSHLAVPVLCEMALAPDAEVRINAALSLACHRSRSATPYLVRALGYSDRGTRRAAALALGLTADPSSATALVLTWRYNLGEVADAAKEGLARIAGREFAGPEEFAWWFPEHEAELGEQLAFVIPPEEKAWKDRTLSAFKARMLDTLPIEERARFWLWKCDVYGLPFGERLVISAPFRRLVALGEGAVGPLAAYLKGRPASQKDAAEAALRRMRSEPGDVEGNMAALASALRRVSDKRLRRSLNAELRALAQKSKRPLPGGVSGPVHPKARAQGASESERCVAATALGEIGGDEAEGALKAALPRECSERVMRSIQAAIEALGL